MKKVFAMLLAVLLLSSMACGQKAGTVETQETAAPVATEAPKAEAQAVAEAEYAKEQGYEPDFSDSRLHHEIYLSDPRKTDSARNRTVIRHPVRKN